MLLSKILRKIKFNSNFVKKVAKYPRLILLVLAIFYIPYAVALDSIIFSVDRISTQDWSLSNAKLSITHINKKTAKMSLLSGQLQLPDPFQTLQLFNIQCPYFAWHKNYVNCTQGKAQLRTQLFKNQTFDFSFQVKNQHAQLVIKNFNLWGGTFSFFAQEELGQWLVTLDAKHIDLQQVKKYIAREEIEVLTGKIDLSLHLKGKQAIVQQVIISAFFKQLSVQDKSGQLATENLSLKSQLTLNKQSQGWQWQTQQKIIHGAFYKEPIYLEVTKQQPLNFSANGFLQVKQKNISIKTASLRHANVGHIQAKAELSYKKDIQIKTATVQMNIAQLEQGSAIYLAPFIEGSQLEGIQLSGTGSLQSEMTLKDNSLTDFALHFKSLNITDSKQRFDIEQAVGDIYWTDVVTRKQASFIYWQALKVKVIPFMAGGFKFSLVNKHLTLLEKSDVAVLGGLFSIQQFDFNILKNNDPDVHFQGAIQSLSLTKLSEALQWNNTLSGTLSGYIPSVRYQNKTLTIEGELKMDLFDGQVTIKKLASSGMFTDFARFYIDLEFENFDLNQVTQKFKIGNIQGRLSGFAHNVYLENWSPVTFYAWMGTPENDDFTHSISHKAVQNIASLGGNSAANIVSRGVLSWFDNFGYSSLGIGCYLYQGVCQMMGVSAAKTGYYLIKGGGLPRIDIIAYNSRVDWNILVQRLRRITTPNEIIIK